MQRSTMRSPLASDKRPASDTRRAAARRNQDESRRPRRSGERSARFAFRTWKSLRIASTARSTDKTEVSRLRTYTHSGMIEHMRVGRLIRDARKRARFSQAGLAARAGTSQPAVARYESERTTPSLSTLGRLLAACGSQLVLGTDPAASRSSGRRGKRGMSAIHGARQRLLQAARRHGIRHIRMFGSVARGEETEHSDIDLLVDLAPGRTLIDLIGFQQEAEDMLGVRVDAAAPRFMKSRVRARAVRDARKV